MTDRRWALCYNLTEHLMDDTRIGTRRFAYLCYGAGPATIVAALMVAGIVTMMLTLN